MSVEFGADVWLPERHLKLGTGKYLSLFRAVSLHSNVMRGGND